MIRATIAELEWNDQQAALENLAVDLKTLAEVAYEAATKIEEKTKLCST